MFRPLEVAIGLRYTRAKRRNHFISFIAFSSMIGIALGVTALITVLSVMNGFQQELRDRILSVTAHATVSEWGSDLRDWPSVTATLEQAPEVVAVAPFVRGEAMLSRAGRVSGAVIQGVDPDRESKVSAIGEKFVAGDLSALAAGEFGIVLGRALAAILGVTVGDKLTVITPQTKVTPVGTMPTLKRFVVVGLFDAGMYEYDRTLALVHFADAARLYRMRDGVTGLRVRLPDLLAAPRIANALAERLPPHYQVSDWTREHANFFRAVQIEKTAMFVILTLIVAVAAFNIVATLVMVVTDKQSDIAILRTLGASPASVMVIFMVQGIAIGLIGTLLGLLGGITLAMNVDVVVPFLENLFNVKFLAPDVYLISDLPSQVQSNDVVLVAAIAFLLATVATIYPAWRAARTQPVEALRYE